VHAGEQCIDKVRFGPEIGHHEAPARHRPHFKYDNVHLRPGGATGDGGRWNSGRTRLRPGRRAGAHNGHRCCGGEGGGRAPDEVAAYQAAVGGALGGCMTAAIRRRWAAGRESSVGLAAVISRRRAAHRGGSAACLVPSIRRRRAAGRANASGLVAAQEEAMVGGRHPRPLLWLRGRGMHGPLGRACPTRAAGEVPSRGSRGRGAGWQSRSARPMWHARVADDQEAEAQTGGCTGGCGSWEAGSAPCRGRRRQRWRVAAGRATGG